MREERTHPCVEPVDVFQTSEKVLLYSLCPVGQKVYNPQGKVVIQMVGELLSQNVWLHDVKCWWEVSKYKSGCGVGSFQMFVDGVTFLHRQPPCPPNVQIRMKPSMCKFKWNRQWISFLGVLVLYASLHGLFTREVRATGLRSFVSLLVPFLGMGITVECFHNLGTVLQWSNEIWSRRQVVDLALVAWSRTKSTSSKAEKYWAVNTRVVGTRLCAVAVGSNWSWLYMAVILFWKKINSQQISVEGVSEKGLVGWSIL